MKVKAVEKKLKFTKDPNDPGVCHYVMSLLFLTYAAGRRGTVP